MNGNQSERSNAIQRCIRRYECKFLMQTISSAFGNGTCDANSRARLLGQNANSLLFYSILHAFAFAIVCTMSSTEHASANMFKWTKMLGRTGGEAADTMCGRWWRMRNFILNLSRNRFELFPFGACGMSRICVYLLVCAKLFMNKPIEANMVEILVAFLTFSLFLRTIRWIRECDPHEICIYILLAKPCTLL